MTSRSPGGDLSASATEREAGPSRPERTRVLDPVARTSEILFGLIMALTFTGTFSAATAGREEVRELLVGMIGCNIAWGLVDAVMFLMAAVTERGHGLVTLDTVRRAGSATEAHAAIRAAIPDVLSSGLTHDDLDRLHQSLRRRGDVPKEAVLTNTDWAGALGVFLLVSLSTFPVVVPFLVIRDAHLAIRVSNAIALVMLFITGYQLARHGGYRPLRVGLAVVLLGLVLVGIAIALGG